VNNVKTEKSFRATGHTPGPLFCRAFARLGFSLHFIEEKLSEEGLLLE